jgi:tetratricopeptide (TPR) repeat protein
MRGEKYREAELALNTCVALRPEYPVSYQLRAEAMCRYAQFLPAKEGGRRAELIRRAREDAKVALELAERANNPAVYWSRGAMFAVLKEVPEALEAYARGLELEREVQKKVSRSKALNEVLAYAEKVLEANPKNADAHAVMALVHLAKAEPKEARAAAKRALAVEPNHRRARAVLAVLDGRR